MTIGILLVACCTAWVACVPAVAITSGFSNNHAANKSDELAPPHCLLRSSGHAIVAAQTWIGKGPAHFASACRDCPDLKWRSDIDHRRASKARARGAPIQSHSGQVDEDPGIRLGLHQIPPRAWIEATEAWRTMRSLSKAAPDYLTHVRAMRGRRFANVKDRR